MDKKQLRDQFQNRARDDPERVFEDLDKDAARLRKPSSSGSRYGTATGAAVCALEAGVDPTVVSPGAISAQSRRSRLSMSRSNRPYGLTCSQIRGVSAA